MPKQRKDVTEERRNTRSRVKKLNSIADISNMPEETSEKKSKPEIKITEAPNERTPDSQKDLKAETAKPGPKSRKKMASRKQNAKKPESSDVNSTETAETSSATVENTKDLSEINKKSPQDPTATPEVVTPKSSPIAVHISPHRSKKTPRKSPLNLASPKTHTIPPLRLSKVPRKLPLTPSESSDDPPNTEKTNSVTSKSDTPKAETSKTEKTKLEDKSTPKAGKSSENKRARGFLGFTIERRSKSPKIVLKSRKSKSRKSSTPKVMSGRVEKRSRDVSLSGSLKKISPRISKKAQLASVKMSPLKLMAMSSSPMVVLQRLSPLNGVKIRENLETPGKVSPLKADASSEGLQTSTPYDKRRSPRATGKTPRQETSPPPNEDHSRKLETPKNNTYEIGDLKVDSETEENNTYDLPEPKTAELKRKSRKYTEANMNQESSKKVCKVRFASPSPKKTINKSRLSPRSAKASSSQRKPGSATPRAFRNLKFLEKKSDTPVSFRRRSHSDGSPKSEQKPKVKRRSNSLIDAKNMRNVSANLSEVSKFAKKPGKSSQESPSFRKVIHDRGLLSAGKGSAKKMPNFAQLHQKIFAKSESIVEAKKRIEERHTALTATPGRCMTPNLKNTNSDVPNSKYTRFGFKLRKPDATSLIIRKKQSPTRTNRQENRNFLKGVRTNRRFELQMKLRNITM